MLGDTGTLTLTQRHTDTQAHRDTDTQVLGLLSGPFRGPHQSLLVVKPRGDKDGKSSCLKTFHLGYP